MPVTGEHAMIVNLQPTPDPRQQLHQQHLANRVEIKIDSYWLCEMPRQILRAVQIGGYVVDHKTRQSFFTGRLVDDDKLVDIPLTALRAQVPLCFARLMTSAFEHETATNPGYSLKEMIEDTDAYAELSAAYNSGNIQTATFLEFTRDLLNNLVPGQRYRMESQLAALLLTLAQSDDPQVKELLQDIARKQWTEMPNVSKLIQELSDDMKPTKGTP